MCLLVKPGNAKPLAYHKGPELFLIFVRAAADDQILIFSPARHLKKGVVQTQLQLFGGFCSTFVEALRENLQIWGSQKNINESVCDLSIGAVPDGACTLNIHINKDISTILEVFPDRIFAGSVKISVHLRVLEKVGVCDFRFELRTC